MRQGLCAAGPALQLHRCGRLACLRRPESEPFRLLDGALVLSVFGEGCARDPADLDALDGERVWEAALAGRLLRLELQQGSLAALLDAG